jgi:hypothetical protein
MSITTDLGSGLGCKRCHERKILFLSGSYMEG